jgi:hypothetical protein
LTNQVSARVPTLAETVPVFGVCVVVVYTWSIYVFLDRVTGWLYHLDLLKLVSIFAYTQAFALFESVVMCGSLVLLAMLLPGTTLRDRFVATSNAAIIVVAGWAVAAQVYDDTIRTWPVSILLLWVGVVCASVVVSAILVRQWRAFERMMITFGKRMTPFLYVYLPISLLSVAVVIIRNM